MEGNLACQHPEIIPIQKVTNG